MFGTLHTPTAGYDYLGFGDVQGDIARGLEPQHPVRPGTYIGRSRQRIGRARSRRRRSLEDIRPDRDHSRPRQHPDTSDRLARIDRPPDDHVVALHRSGDDIGCERYPQLGGHPRRQIPAASGGGEDDRRVAMPLNLPGQCASDEIRVPCSLVRQRHPEHAVGAQGNLALRRAWDHGVHRAAPRLRQARRGTHGLARNA